MAEAQASPPPRSPDRYDSVGIPAAMPNTPHTRPQPTTSRAATAVPMCIYLFDVQAQSTFWNVFPRWLLAGSGLFLATAAAVILFSRHSRQRSGRLTREIEPDTFNSHNTALLWVMCTLAILISMHALVIWVAAAGLEFR